MITLKFPPTMGGEEDGLNDSGIETFEGEFYRHVARECGQNACDAAVSSNAMVRLNFMLESLPSADIPCFDQLRKALDSGKQYWEDEKSIAFFETALEATSHSSIMVMKISDFNTTGLTGSDSDKRGKWFGLIRSAGVSSKADPAAGGSFGIGKYAPFAASLIRTVFYSTLTEQGDYAFQGVSRLASHLDEDGATTQCTGYAGLYDPSRHLFKDIRCYEDITQYFRRTEPGTDIFILCYRNPSEWQGQIVKAVLANFWPAIHFNKIELQVGSMSITSRTLGQLLSQYSTNEDFNHHLYYNALISDDSFRFSKSLKHLGKVSLYLLAGNDSYPNRIAMTRNTGMVIDYYAARSRKPYSGLFVCENEDGNILLRKMEPPRHDMWDPNRIEGPKGRLALQELYQWIRECVKELNPAVKGKILTIPDLQKYLPDDDTEGEEFPESADDASHHEGIDRTPTAEPIAVSTATINPVPREHIIDVGDTGGDDGGAGGKRDPAGGDGVNTGGSVRRTGGAGEEPGTSKPSKLRSVKLRYYSDGSSPSYILTVRTENEYNGDLLIRAVGEDGVEEPINIVEAQYDEPPIEVRQIEPGVLPDVSLKPHSPFRVKLRLSSARRLALKAYIYEN